MNSTIDTLITVLVYALIASAAVALLASPFVQVPTERSQRVCNIAFGFFLGIAFVLFTIQILHL